MSIIIHELNLPTHYDMAIRITPGGEVYDEDLGGSFAKAKQLPPHGRLIDADAQIERAKRLNLSTAGIIAQLLESAPTIIEAEAEE